MMQKLKVCITHLKMNYQRQKKKKTVYEKENDGQTTMT
jgi:hypothetical protein